ncbi:MAG: hypothetical protein ACRDCW_07960 [Sarcina sp.]
MKTVIAMIVGGAIVLGIFFGISSSSNLVLDSQTVLKSPKVNTSVSRHTGDISNLSNNTKNNIEKNQNTNNEMVQVNNTSNSMTEFKDLIQNEGLLYGTVSNGAQIIIPCSEGEVKNNELIVPEYYVNMPWETFTDYITANGNGNFVINEFYNGKQTGRFNLQENENTISGQFTHMTNGATAEAKFVSIKTNNQRGELSRKPFYIGVIGQTAVTLTNEFNGQYIEYYHGDKNLFTIEKQENSSNSNYDIQLNEYYQNNLTGEYFLNDVGNDTYTGIFIKAPNSADPVKSTVGLTGSNSPFSV